MHLPSPISSQTLSISPFTQIQTLSFSLKNKNKTNKNKKQRRNPIKNKTQNVQAKDPIKQKLPVQKLLKVKWI